VTGLAENTRRMMTADGVGVTLIAPGGVHTNFWQRAGGVPINSPKRSPALSTNQPAWM
jgi:hypothetical protein